MLVALRLSTFLCMRLKVHTLLPEGPSKQNGSLVSQLLHTYSCSVFVLETGDVM